MITKNSLRIDKFLWAVRLCKTRKIAYHLCNKKKIKINDIICKPSKIIDKDNLLEINKNNIFYKYKILNLTSKRLPAKLVGDFIKDITPLEELDKLKIKNIYPRVLRKKGTGRPTKKERRILIKNKLIN